MTLKGLTYAANAYNNSRCKHIELKSMAGDLRMYAKGRISTLILCMICLFFF